jgi:hypothetical protein
MAMFVVQAWDRGTVRPDHPDMLKVVETGNDITVSIVKQRSIFFY